VFGIEEFDLATPQKRQRRSALSRGIIALLVLAMLIVTFIAGFSIFNETGSSQSESSETTNSTLIEQLVSQIAYSHWNYVSKKNLTGIFSQYSSYYQAVWFFFNGSNALSGLNGRHDCNPAEGVDCSYNVRSAWMSFFNDTPSFGSFSVCGYNVSQQLGQRALVSATVWLETSNKNPWSNVSTIEVPYQIVFEFVNGSWQFWKEYFGLPAEPALLFAADVSPPLTCS